MNEKQFADREAHFLRQGLLLIAAATLIGWALMVHYGSRPAPDYWASWATINGSPSVEIRP